MAKKNKISIPLEEKMTWTLREGSEISGIGINKLQNLCNQPDCTFSFSNGRVHMIKREEFLKWYKKIKKI